MRIVERTGSRLPRVIALLAICLAAAGTGRYAIEVRQIG